MDRFERDIREALTAAGELAVPHTATVELKTVRVNNQQMTVALYNQLPEVDPAKLLWEPSSSVWGWVNVCPHDCERGASPLAVRIRRVEAQGYKAKATFPKIPESVRKDLYDHHLQHVHLIGVWRGQLCRAAADYIEHKSGSPDYSYGWGWELEDIMAHHQLFIEA